MRSEKTLTLAEELKILTNFPSVSHSEIWMLPLAVATTEDSIEKSASILGRFRLGAEGLSVGVMFSL